MTHSIRFMRIVSMTDQVVAELQGLQFTSFQHAGASWRPAVNVYARPDRLEVCVDLAGVHERDIAVQVERRRLVIRGRRALPVRDDDPARAARILVMEIPDGGFERTLEFSVDVDPDRVEARHDNGWLWITLPRIPREALP